MPWKNGGGTTVELHREGDGPAGFGWRVSIATVPGDGPFSRFDGYDRHIMAIEGDGFTLEGGPGGPIPVHPVFEPRHFSGDWSIFGRVRNGPSRDFNLIALRERFMSSIDVLGCGLHSTVEAGSGWAFFHVLSGEAAIGGDLIQQAESILLAPGAAATFAVTGTGACVALCRVIPLGGQEAAAIAGAVSNRPLPSNNCRNSLKSSV